MSVNARLPPLERVREQGVAALFWFYSKPKACILVSWSFGILETRQQVFNPPACCGSVATALCGAWRPPSFMEKLVVESSIKVTGELGVSLGSLVVVSQVVPVRDLVAGKQYSC